VARQLADVTEAIGFRAISTNAPEVLDADDPAGVDLCRPSPRRSSPRQCPGTFRGSAIDGADEHCAIVLDVDLCAGSSWMALMVFPPGPISLPIFCGSILTVSRRGAHLLISFRGSGSVWAILSRMTSRASLARWKSFTNDLVRDAFGLDVELDGGDAFAVPQTLKSHVAEVIFLAEDVGEEGGLVALLTRPTEIPATGRVIGTPASISAGIRPQLEAHRARPVGFEDVADNADGVGELIDARQHRDEAALGQSAVPDLASARAADRPHFATL